MVVFADLFPGLSARPKPESVSSTSGSETENTFLAGMFQVVGLVRAQQYDAAAAAAKRFIEHHPRYNYVYLLALVAIKQWQSGDQAGALVHLETVIDLLESAVPRSWYDAPGLR